jgi:hypothetical protein
MASRADARRRDATLGFSNTFAGWPGNDARWASILWFVVITAGGNIIMSVHALLQLSGFRLVEPASALFRQKAA